MWIQAAGWITPLAQPPSPTLSPGWAAQTPKPMDRQEHSGPLDQPFTKTPHHSQGRAQGLPDRLDPPRRCLGSLPNGSGFLAFFSNASDPGFANNWISLGPGLRTDVASAGPITHSLRHRSARHWLPLLRKRGLPAELVEQTNWTTPECALSTIQSKVRYDPENRNILFCSKIFSQWLQSRFFLKNIYFAIAITTCPI